MPPSMVETATVNLASPVQKSQQSKPYYDTSSFSLSQTTGAPFKVREKLRPLARMIFFSPETIIDVVKNSTMTQTLVNKVVRSLQKPIEVLIFNKLVGRLVQTKLIYQNANIFIIGIKRVQINNIHILTDNFLINDIKKALDNSVFIKKKYIPLLLEKDIILVDQVEAPTICYNLAVVCYSDIDVVDSLVDEYDENELLSADDELELVQYAQSSVTQV